MDKGLSAYKTFLLILTLVISGILGYQKFQAYNSQLAEEMQSPAPAEMPQIKPDTMEHKLQILNLGGITLQEPFTVADLLRIHDRAKYERRDFSSLVFAIASKAQTSHGPAQLSSNIALFNIQCPDSANDYSDMAGRILHMAGGHIPVSDLRVEVGPEAGQAQLSYTFEGRDLTHGIDCAGDILAPDFFSIFAAMIGIADSEKVLVFHKCPECAGQVLIGVVTRQQLETLQHYGAGFSPVLRN